VVDACEQPSNFRFLYSDDATIEDKIEAIARRVYRASDVFFYPEAKGQIERFTANGLGPPAGLHGQDSPVAVSRRFTAHAPRDFTLPVRDVRAYTGAGWLVPLCGGHPADARARTSAAALNVDIDEDGRTVGLF